MNQQSIHGVNSRLESVIPGQKVQCFFEGHGTPKRRSLINDQRGFYRHGSFVYTNLSAISQLLESPTARFMLFSVKTEALLREYLSHGDLYAPQAINNPKPLKHKVISTRFRSHAA